MLRSLIPALFLLFSLPSARAQLWVDLMLDGETNLHDVKAAFDAEWEGRGYERGKGWKQFQRWYWFWDQRTWPDGERPDPSVYLDALQQARLMREQRGGLRDAAIWESMGPVDWTSWSYNPGNGRVNCVAVHPYDPNTIYAGTPSGGLWRSTDNGGTWQVLYTDLASMGVSGIVIRPDEPNTIYVATGDGDGADTWSSGVIKSTDGGTTWETTGLDWNITQTRTTRALRMDPMDPDRMYCAASNGLFRTTDGGATWDNVQGGSFRDVEFMPGDSSIVYACTNRFFRSEDGITFTAVTAGLPPQGEVSRMAIAVSPANPLIVYALCGRSSDQGFHGLYRSVDGGLTFSTRSTQPNIFGYAEDGLTDGGQAWYDMALAVDPDDPDVVYVGGINVWKSTNGGLTWSIRSHWVYPSVVGYTHADIHSLDIIGGRLFCGSDGGLFSSGNGALSWTDLSEGLNITQFYRIGGSELNPGLVLGGAQDNGSNRLRNGEWIHVFGADGMECAVDPTNPDIIYVSSQNGGILRSNLGGQSFESVNDFITEPGPWVTPYVIDPVTPTRLVAGYLNLWISEDRGNSWFQATEWLGTESMRCIAIAPSDPNVIYAARNDRVVRSDDGGFTWSNIRFGLPNLSPTSFGVDPEDPYHVWITFSGTSANQKVYESLAGGVSWINRSAGLPNASANSIVCQANSPNGVYLGTDVGVFYRDDVTGAWEVYGEGLPNVVVSELEINYNAGKLRAGTYGRGLWQANLFYSPFAAIGEGGAAQAPRVLPLDMLGRFTIQGDDRMDIVRLRVIDTMGRDVHTQRWTGHGAVLDLSTRAAGAYTVLIEGARRSWAQRVVVGW
jgi:photosystem II stability/assembly factor-like uncharacterized protein